MGRGRVYHWTPDRAHPLGGRIDLRVVSLPNLDILGVEAGYLWGRYVRVRNAGWLYRRDLATGGRRAVPIGDAQPNADGDFLFCPERGGGRVDKVDVVKPIRRIRYVEAAHFG